MKPNYNHCAECKKLGKICPECEGMLDEGEDGGVVDGVPMTKFTVTSKRLAKDDDLLDEGEDGGVVEGIPVTKFTVIGKKRKLPENEGLSDESIEIADALIAKDKKSKSIETGERYGDEDLDKSNDDAVKDGMEHLKFLRDQLSEAKDDDEKKRIKDDISEWSALLLKRHKQHRPAPADTENITDKKKKSPVSLLDLFNPSRPMGMR